jgi:FlaA1/EpsC-like NDP-sugar epimerase
VGISTDKAAKPINTMGMTKALQERIFTSANIHSHGTRFICVRYGNVLASRGSVIPFFHQQILNGGPLTVTLPEMTRFLLTLEEAVDTIVAAIRDAAPGETFVPMVPSATVIDIANALKGNSNIEIQIKGIRPAEKIHEILISEEEMNYTHQVGNYYVIRSMLPEINGGVTNHKNILSKEYSSKDHVLSFEETVELLRKHDLLTPRNYSEELLR